MWKRIFMFYEMLYVLYYKKIYIYECFYNIKYHIEIHINRNIILRGIHICYATSIILLFVRYFLLFSLCTSQTLYGAD